jgi:transglutaminase-like putative cysteine protease
MIAACRAAGIAARYVSGHLVGEGGSHAWVEALIPHPDHPGEWAVEAWDPTHDRPAGDGYVTIAVGRDYADVAPLSGSYITDHATGQLSVHKRLVAERS